MADDGDKDGPHPAAASVTIPRTVIPVGCQVANAQGTTKNGNQRKPAPGSTRLEMAAGVWPQKGGIQRHYGNDFFTDPNSTTDVMLGHGTPFQSQPLSAGSGCLRNLTLQMAHCQENLLRHAEAG